VLAEIKALEEAGSREIVLTGIDLGSYHSGSYALEQLLTGALETSSDCRFRLSSIELPSINDELIQLIATSEGRICEHLHVPLQSGSDAVLTAMKRRYDSQTFLSRMKAIKKELPRLSLTTDVIVGFPGETDQDFNKTFELSRKLGFSRMHVFRYSMRPNTPAAVLPNQLPPQKKAERAKALQGLAEELTEMDALARIGTTELMLIEGPHKGRSESYYPVQVKENVQRGSLIALKIVGYAHGQLIAEKG